VWIDGYSDWKHVVGAIEVSRIHFNLHFIYKQWQLHGTLSEELAASIRKEKSFLCQLFVTIHPHQADVQLQLVFCKAAGCVRDLTYLCGSVVGRQRCK
jgi:hypothetical protein